MTIGIGREFPYRAFQVMLILVDVIQFNTYNIYMLTVVCCVIE